MTDAHLVGYVHIRAHEADTKALNQNRHHAHRLQTRTLGAWVGEGAGAGYRDSIRITLPPECAVLFLVPDMAMLDRVRTLLKSDPTLEDVCAELQ